MRAAAVPLLLSLLAVPALTASNGLPPASAGAGAGTVSGFAVSKIRFSLDGDAIEAVSFELAPASARRVKVRFAPERPWADCDVVAGKARCPTATPLADAVALEVAAAS